jgi:lipopolysaccharide export system protein LptC
MSVTPLTSGPRPPPRGPARPALPRSLADIRRPARLASPQRRWLVGLAKRVLPLFALALLLLVAFWPEIQGTGDRSRISYRRIDITPEGGQLTDAHYQGVDASGRPYTVTATRVRQLGPERTDLEAPKADMQMQSGEWLMVQAKRGIYEQKANRLDLAGEVILYRDDGTVLVTESASLDLRANAAAGHEMVHAEGPFGVLDAQGFTVLDRGAVVQFTGPARLVLNGDRK